MNAAAPGPKLAVVVTNGDWSQMIDALRGDGFIVSVKTSPKDALTFLADVNPEVAVLGMDMADHEQLELLDRLQDSPQVIVLGSEPKPRRVAP